MVSLELRQVRDQPSHEQRGVAADGEDLVRTRNQQVLGGLHDVRKGIGEFCAVDLAASGQLETAVRPVEQLEPQPSFQRLDLVAHRALGDVQFFGGSREAQVPRHALEDTQGVERGKFGVHGQRSCNLR